MSSTSLERRTDQRTLQTRRLLFPSVLQLHVFAKPIASQKHLFYHLWHVLLLAVMVGGASCCRRPMRREFWQSLPDEQRKLLDFSIINFIKHLKAGGEKLHHNVIYEFISLAMQCNAIKLRDIFQFPIFHSRN